MSDVFDHESNAYDALLADKYKPVNVTLEWHWYCPKCERSCLSRYHGDKVNKVVICSDCGFKYKVNQKVR